MITAYPGLSHRPRFASAPAAKEKADHPKHEAPHNLDDVIRDHQSQMQKMKERMQRYDDPQWIAERKQQLQQQIDNLAQEVEILQKLRQQKPAA